MKTWGRGTRKSSNVIRGDHFSEVVTFKGGRSAKISPCLAPNPPPPPPAMNNDRSLNNLSEQENIFYGDDKKTE